MNLSDNEKREIALCIEGDKPLPLQVDEQHSEDVIKVVGIFGNDTMKIIEVVI